MDRTLIIRFDARTLVLAGAIVVMAAAFLPWMRLPPFLVGDLALRGLSAGGWATLALAFIAALSLLLPWQPLKRVSLPAAFLSIWIHLIALVAFVRTVQWATMLEMDPLSQLGAVGSGLMLTFAGAWLMLFGGVGNATPPVTLRWQRGWMGYAAWGGLLVVVLASCLCAWSIGLIVRPYDVAHPTPAATFGPAPTVYMATPLIDVQLEPLGQPGVAVTVAPTSVRATPSPASTAGANLAVPPSPTNRPNPATLPATVNPARSATPTLTVFSNPATQTAVASPATWTSTPAPSATPSPTTTAQPGAATSTPSPSPTSTSTSTSNSSPLKTPTPPTSPILPR